MMSKVRYEHSYIAVQYPLNSASFYMFTYIRGVYIHMYVSLNVVLNVFTRSLHILCHYKMKDSGKSPLFSLFTTVCNCPTLLN